MRNGSRGGVPAPGVEVVLRVRVDDRFLVAAETATNEEGRFLFEHLPIEADFLYLPGANQDGVHYPGKRIRLTPQRPNANVDVVVYDAVTEPNPLIVRRHEISVHPEPGVLKVTETLVVANPTTTCYVGKASDDDELPVTLQLSIPADFERTTFHKEFFGRRFSLVKGKLVTAIPWPPGERELKFTYLLRNEERNRLWQRPLDLPSSHIRLCVFTDKPDEVACNLPPASQQRHGQKVFEQHKQVLPAGYVIRLEIGRLPVRWMTYGRWLAIVVLVGLAVGTHLLAIRRKNRRQRRPGDAASSSRSAAVPRPASLNRGSGSRRNRKRKASTRRRR